MKPKTVNIQNREFHLNPMKPRQAMRVTKNLVQMIGAGVKGDSKQDVLSAISKGLHSVTDAEFDELCLLMFNRVQTILPTGPIEIDSAEAFDAAFEGIDLENIFLLMYEVLVYNRFPLVRDLDLDIGELMKEIALFGEDETSTKDKEKNLEIPESSAKN